MNKKTNIKTESMNISRQFYPFVSSPVLKQLYLGNYFEFDTQGDSSDLFIKFLTQLYVKKQKVHLPFREIYSFRSKTCIKSLEKITRVFLIFRFRSKNKRRNGRFKEVIETNNIYLYFYVFIYYRQSSRITFR